MRLDLSGAFLQASLLNPHCKYIENAPGSSWGIPSSFLIKSLLYIYIENAPGPSWCIPSSLLIKSLLYIDRKCSWIFLAHSFKLPF